VLIDPRTFRRLVDARALLVDGAHDDLTIQAIAGHVGLSPYQLIRRFDALFGTTPHRLRTQARLERARARLAAGATVTDTCLEVGFSSLGSFSALFTRWVGTSPTRYRRIVQVPADRAPLVPGCLGLLSRLPSRNSREAGRA
jgi:AraC-like DNA-binding protein